MMRNVRTEEILYYADLLGRDRPEIRRMVQKAYLDPQSEYTIVKHMRFEAQKRGFDLSNLPVFSLNLPDEMDENGMFAGQAILGNGSERRLFLPLDSFSRHSLVSGMTRSWKSAFIKSLIPQFIARGIYVWIFDNEDEYTSLLNLVDPSILLVLDSWTDRDNFFEPPPETHPEEWLAKLRNMIRELWIREGGINLIDELNANLYRNRGIFDGSTNYPTIVDVVNFLDAIRFKSNTRYSQYHESLINRFRGLHGNLRRVLACRQGYGLGELMKKCVIFRLRNLSDEFRLFYVSMKMLKIMTCLEKHSFKGMKIVFVIDEAHKLYNKEIAKRYDLGEPLVFKSTRTFAKRGIGLIYSDQVPSELPPSLFGNINNRFTMRLTTARCISAISMAMNLRPEQAEFLPLIPEKHSILQSGEFPHPVLFRIPEISFNDVSDEEIRDRMEKMLAELEYVPIEDAIEASSEKSAGAALSGEKSRPSARPNRLWTEIAKLLAEIRWISLTDLAAHLGSLAPWHLRKALAAMERQDLIELCPISFGTRGNPKTFVVLKQKGAEFIGLKFDDVKLPGKGSTEHVILQNLLAEAMKDAGKAVAIEHSSNGKAVDIAELSDDGATAYEIELAPSHPHVAENVLRDLEAGFDEVVIVTRNQAGQNEAKDQIYKAVPWEKLQRVKFRLLREFF